MEEMADQKFTVGMVVAIPYRFGAPRKTVVTRVTPSGRFKVEGHNRMFSPQGHEIGAGSVWNRLWCRAWTAKDDEAVEVDRIDRLRRKLAEYSVWKSAPAEMVDKVATMIAELPNPEAK
jgi:hypothetical protein